MSDDKRSLIRALKVLTRLMNGGTVSVPSLIEHGTVENDATGRRMMNELEEGVAGVVRVPGTRPMEWVYSERTSFLFCPFCGRALPHL